MDVQLRSSWYKNYVLSVVPDLENVDKVVQSRASAVVTTDDVPGISRLLRQKYTRVYRTMSFDRIPINRGYSLIGPLPPPPRLVVSEEDMLRMEAGMLSWGDVARSRPSVWNWVRRMENRGCPRWLTREFVGGNAPGLVDLDPKFRGLMSNHVLREVSKIKAGTVTGWLSAYNTFIAAVCMHLRDTPEYHLYGHM